MWKQMKQYIMYVKHLLLILDRDFLLHHGGIEEVSLTNILTNDSDDDELHRQPTIISRSSYYNLKDLIPILEKTKVTVY